MKYDRIRKNPSRLQSLTGFSIEEFESFLPTFKYEWDEYYSHYTLQGKVRERISYGRRSSLLPMIGDKLLFILSYLKNNPLQEYHGATFGMTQPQCNEWIHLLSEILLKTLKTLEVQSVELKVVVVIVGDITQNAENTRRVARSELSTDAACPSGHTGCAA
jgi:hypothetical protein